MDAARGVTARPRVGVIDRRVSGIMDADAEENIVVAIVVEVTVVDAETKNVADRPNERRFARARVPRRRPRATAGPV